MGYFAWMDENKKKKKGGGDIVSWNYSPVGPALDISFIHLTPEKSQRQDIAKILNMSEILIPWAYVSSAGNSRCS